MHHTRVPTARLFPKDNIKLRKQIINVHNRLRQSVHPPASDMLRMVSSYRDIFPDTWHVSFQTWDKEAAEIAQSYAEECRGLTHNSAKGRYTRRLSQS